MTAHFLNDLDHTYKDLLSMGGMVEDAIRKATSALVDRRAELVDVVIEGDKRIDASENNIEEHCLHMLALHQPVAKDLRIILTVMKVNNELERIGDHAKNIAEAADFLCKHEPITIYQELIQMSETTLEMLKDSLDALLKQDKDLAQAVRDRDDEVDAVYVSMMKHISADMEQYPQMVQRGLRAIAAARNLERVADIATNICKDVQFLVNGEIIRHSSLNK